MFSFRAHMGADFFPDGVRITKKNIFPKMTLREQ